MFKKTMKKRGEFALDNLGWWLFAAAVLVVVVVGMYYFSRSGKGGTGFIRDLLRFAK